VVEVKAGDYREIRRKLNLRDILEGLGEGAALAVDGCRRAVQQHGGRGEPEPAQSDFWLAARACDERNAAVAGASPFRMLQEPEPWSYWKTKMLADRVKNCWKDAAVPKTIHDLKLALHISASATSLSRE